MDPPARPPRPRVAPRITVRPVAPSAAHRATVGGDDSADEHSVASSRVSSRRSSIADESELSLAPPAPAPGAGASSSSASFSQAAQLAPPLSRPPAAALPRVIARPGAAAAAAAAAVAAARGRVLDSIPEGPSRRWHTLLRPDGKQKTRLRDLLWNETSGEPSRQAQLLEQRRELKAQQRAGRGGAEGAGGHAGAKGWPSGAWRQPRVGA